MKKALKALSALLDALLPILLLTGGAGLITAGASLIWPPAGLITAGVLAITGGVLIIRGGGDGDGDKA